MNKYIIGLIAMVGIIAIFASNLQAVNASSSGTATAKVTVSKTIDISVSGGPIDFGSLSQGTTKSPATNNIGSPLNITIEADTNVQTDINQSATGDFIAGSNTLGIGNLTYFSSNSVGSAIEMTTSYTDSVLSGWQNISPGDSVNAYYWLTIPNSQPAGSYQTTINIQAIEHQ